MSKVKQVIVLRTSFPDGKGGTFKPRLGKMAAQAAHASMKVLLDRGSVVRGGLASRDSACGTWFPEEGTRQLPTPALVIPLEAPMVVWVEGTFTKVVLGVETEEELLRVHEEAKARGLPTALVTDVGATEFHGVATNTAVAIGPDLADLIDAVTGRDGVVKCRLL